MNERWITAWREGRTAFHQAGVNQTLLDHGHHLLEDGPHRVLVPLCGKSVDLPWLVDQGHDVIGVELSELAVDALYREAGRDPEIVPGEPTLYRSERLSVFQGDLFALAPEQVRATWCGGTCPVRVWDRASMIALPPDRRGAYVDQIRRLAGPRGRILLDTLIYDQALMSGPPFSVDEGEVRARYPDAKVEVLDFRPIPIDPRWAQAGVDQLFQSVFLVDL